MSTIGVAAASYEGSLFSWKANIEEEDAAKNKEGKSVTTMKSDELVMTSGFHCCAASLRAVSASCTGKYMACGGKDERIHIFNMWENTTLGELTAHTGGITCLDFFEDSHLLSGSDDNSICIWRTYDWMCLHILGGHKASINSVSIHPSGKLALSVAQDNTLKLWNLVQGRIAFTRRLKGSADIVKWLKPSGDSYLLVVSTRVEAYKTSDNSCTTVIRHSSRVNMANFTGVEENIVTVCEDKNMRVYNAHGDMVSRLDFSSLGTRIRDFSLVNSKDNQQTKGFEVMTLATSSGKVVLIDMCKLDVAEGGSTEEDVVDTPLETAVMTSFDVKAEPRLTCISAWYVDGERPTSKKGKRVKRKKEAGENAIEGGGEDNSNQKKVRFFNNSKQVDEPRQNNKKKKKSKAKK